MPAKLKPRLASRERVQVVLRDRRATSPDCSDVKRCWVFAGVKRTLPASPNTAAATARQRSTSMPRQTPLESGCENPASPVLTPHCTKPFLRTASRVDCAAALVHTSTSAAASHFTKGLLAAGTRARG